MYAEALEYNEAFDEAREADAKELMDKIQNDPQLRKLSLLAERIAQLRADGADQETISLKEDILEGILLKYAATENADPRAIDVIVDLTGSSDSSGNIVNPNNGEDKNAAKKEKLQELGNFLRNLASEFEATAKAAAESAAQEQTVSDRGKTQAAEAQGNSDESEQAGDNLDVDSDTPEVLADDGTPNVQGQEAEAEQTSGGDKDQEPRGRKILKGVKPFLKNDFTALSWAVRRTGKWLKDKTRYAEGRRQERENAQQEADQDSELTLGAVVESQSQNVRLVPNSNEQPGDSNEQGVRSAELEPISLDIGTISVPAAYRGEGGEEEGTSSEDYLITDRENGIFVVADGMGGYSNGDIAARVGAQAGHTALEDLEFHNLEQVNKGMRGALNEARIAVRDNGEGGAAVATFVKLFESEDDPNSLIMAVAHAGDTRLIAYTPDGEIMSITEDQSTGHFVSNSLGMDTVDGRRDHIVVASVPRGAKLLLCSDGITGDYEPQFFTDEEFQDVFSQSTAQASAERALRLSRKIDDKTAIVINVQ